MIARTAAKRRAKADPNKKVVIHPVAIRYKFIGDIEGPAGRMLDEIESRLTWAHQPMPLYDRVHKIGGALLALKELEYLGEAANGPVGPRLEKLANAILWPLEDQWLKQRHTDAVPSRVKRLRSAILPDMTKGELEETELQRRWKNLADLYLAQQLFHYPPDYLQNNPSPDRMMETIERLEEDLTDHIRQHNEIHATITVGEAIEVSPERPRGGADPLMGKVHEQLSQLLGVTAKTNGIFSMIIGIRIVVIVLSLLVWRITQKLLSQRNVPIDDVISGTPADTSPAVIVDRLHQLTAHLNQHLHHHQRQANGLLIASSLIIDVLGISLVFWAILGRSFEPFLGLFLVFALRQICQSFCPLPPPIGMIWRSPGCRRCW